MLPSTNQPADTVLFPCPGCGRREGSHPPMCQVAVRLSAARAQYEGGDWRRRLLNASLFFVELYGCRWAPVVRHLRTAASDNPSPEEPGELLIYAPADGLFRRE